MDARKWPGSLQRGLCMCMCTCMCYVPQYIRVHVLPAVLTCVRGGTKGEREREREREGGEEEERRNAMWNTLALDGSLSLSRPRGKFGSCFKPG